MKTVSFAPSVLKVTGHTKGQGAPPGEQDNEVDIFTVLLWQRAHAHRLLALMALSCAKLP